MSARCQLTGRKPGFGNEISHSHRRGRRRFAPSVRTKRYWLPSEGRRIRPTLRTKCIRAVDAIGIEAAEARVRAREALRMWCSRGTLGRLWVNPDRGLKTRDWPKRHASPENLVAAARAVRGFRGSSYMMGKAEETDDDWDF